MTMVALKNITPGQQILNDFGQLPRSDLLRRYGFLTDNYKRWDVVEVDIETITQATSKHNTLKNRVSIFLQSLFSFIRCIALKPSLWSAQCTIISFASQVWLLLVDFTHERY